jgi:hypothetical protein
MFSSICKASSRVGAITSTRVPRRWPGGQRGEPGEHGQRERRRLARAGLRDADEVVPGENRRDGGGLDRRGLGVAGVLHGVQNFGVKAKAAKWHGIKVWDGEMV